MGVPAVAATAVAALAAATPSSGPILLGSDSGSGAHVARAHVFGRVARPKSFSVRVRSTPSGRPVQVTWDVQCFRPGVARSAHGRFSRKTPVVDGRSFALPLAAPAYCIYGVTAVLPRRGNVALSVYARRG